MTYSPIPGFAPDDPIHNYATLAEAEALTAARHQRALAAVEDYISNAQMANPKERMTGPKVVGTQIPVPAHVNPFSGLKCFVRGCKEPVQGFVTHGTLAMPEPRKSVSERHAEIIGRMSEAAGASLTFDEIELASKYGYPADKLQAGMVGPKPGIGQQVPEPKRQPACLAHLNAALAPPVPEPVKASRQLTVSDLDKSRNWKELASDPTFVNVTDGKVSVLISRAQWNARLNGEL